MLEQSSLTPEIFAIVGMGVALILLLVLSIFFKNNRKYILRKDAEEKIAQTKSELERNVLERTEALHRSEKRFQALIENANDIIVLVDKNMHTLYVSPAFEKVTGFTLEDMQGKNGFFIIHPDYVEESREILKEILKTPGVPKTRVNRLLHKRGHYIWVEGTVTNLLDDENVKGIVANYRDITQRKQAEENLLVREKRFENLIENSFDVIGLYNAKMEIIYLSPSFERLTGFTIDEVKAGIGLKFAHPDDVVASEELIIKVLENHGVPFLFQNRMLHKDGHYIWVEGVLTNLLQEPGVEAIVSNYRDITERKGSEEK